MGDRIALEVTQGLAECKSISQKSKDSIVLADLYYRATLSPWAPGPRDQVAG